jgi:hypothetical protein
MTRALFFAVCWLVLVSSCLFVTGDARGLFDWRAALYVALVPLLASAAAHGPSALAAALRDARAPADLPAERRGASAAVLRDLGGIAFGAGLVVFLGSLIGAFNALAMEGGQARAGVLLSSFGEMTLGPVYGLALWLFLWSPLAAGLEQESGLGGELMR